MSTASVSRSSAPFELASQNRRSDRSTSEQAFTLPPEPPRPSNDPRPRLDADREAGNRTEQTQDSKAVARDGASERKTSTRTDDASAAETTSDGGTSSDRTEKTAAGETQTQGKAGETSATETKATGTAGDAAATGKTVEERKAALAAALEGAPVIGEATPEEAAAAGAVLQPPTPSEIGAEFLALTTGAGQATTDTGGQDGTATVAAATEATAAAKVSLDGVLSQLQAAVAVGAGGETRAGGDAAAADIAAGLPPQLAAVSAEQAAKAGAKPADAASGQDGKTAGGDKSAADTETTQESGKETAEAGKASGTSAATDPKAGDSKTTDTRTTEASSAGQATQASAADEAQPAAGAQQPSAPLSPQAILAAGPLTLTTPQAPLTELDAAAQATAQAQAEAAEASHETTRPTPLHIVPVEIGARALAGNKRFDIRLDPAELGRIDVSLQISDEGDVSAKLTVDRVETLHMLQRDARTLERAFEQAGLKPSEGGVEIGLRDPSDQSGSRQQRQEDEGSRTRRAWVETSEDIALDTTAPPPRGGRLGGVDLSI